MNKAWIVLPAIVCGLVASGATAPRAGAAPHHDAHAAAHAARPAASPAIPAAEGAAWNPSQCGREPVAPGVDTSTVDRYNASVDRVTLYEKAARTFNACVSKAATIQQTAISNEARTRIDAIQTVSGGVQKRIAGNFASLTTALRAGAPKLQSSAAAH
jgi:hypothetical protein